MKIVILYHPQSDHARTVESFAEDFAHNTGYSIELVSLESRDGSAMATLHDIVRYPAVLALNEANETQHVWEGPVMPLINELAYYIQG